MTFAPSFPTRPDLAARSPCEDGLPLLGLSKDHPSIVSRRGVHSRWPRASKPAFVSPSGREVPTSHPCSAPVVSHHLDGFLLLPAACGPLRDPPPPCRRCVHIAARFRSWGSRRFSNPGAVQALANQPDPASHLPVVLSCPSKPSLPTQPRWPDKLARRHHLSSAGDRHPHRRSPDCGVHQPPCPLAVHLCTDDGKFPSHLRSRSSTSRPCSVPGFVANRAVARSLDPLLPWA